MHFIHMSSNETKLLQDLASQYSKSDEIKSKEKIQLPSVVGSNVNVIKPKF